MPSNRLWEQGAGSVSLQNGLSRRGNHEQCGHRHNRDISWKVIWDPMVEAIEPTSVLWIEFLIKFPNGISDNSTAHAVCKTESFTRLMGLKIPHPLVAAQTPAVWWSLSSKRSSGVIRPQRIFVGIFGIKEAVTGQDKIGSERKMLPQITPLFSLRGINRV
jgi:hypothetical protein